ncbi:MAG: hypothetical protein J6Y78_10360 [Paludibacteraceae bacterium]|nr:hypothetical protein [Paludibacteraceae bacterium]
MLRNIIPYEILIKKSLSFIPSNEQAIYIENEYDEEVNAYIRKHYESIKHAFHMRRIDFCYFPFRTSEQASTLLAHYNPYTLGKLKTNCNFSTKEFVGTIFDGKVPGDLKPSIIIYNKYKSTQKDAYFLAIEFDKNVLEEKEARRPLWQKLLGMGRKPHLAWESMYDEMACYLSGVLLNTHEIDNGKCYYSHVNWYDDAYWSDLKEHGELIAEIDLRIHQLQERGVDSLILKKILNNIVDDSRPLSRVTITKDLRIILNDYGEMEIRMEPINKAIFLLFLRHEEGIRIKELCNYRSELESLYTRLSHDDREKRQESMDKILNPTNNSINEKISRVRQAFIARFEDDLASNYYIKGPRGEAKGICIDRTMVTWE